MPHAQRLRLADVRQAMRLVGECRELGRDPVQWRTHVCQRLTDWVGAANVLSFELNHPVDDRRPRLHVVVGLDAWGHRLLAKYMADPAWPADPLPGVIQRAGRSSLTFVRREALSDPVWYASPAVTVVRRSIGIDDCLTSHRLLVRHGIADELNLNRPIGDRPFSRRDRRCVALFHTELARLWTGRPASAAVPAQVRELPPRVQRVYDLLTRGDTERQAAIKLGIAQQTVHSYVKQLYSRLNVSSRAELIVRFLPGYDFIPRLTTTPVGGR